MIHAFVRISRKKWHRLMWLPIFSILLFVPYCKPYFSLLNFPYASDFNLQAMNVAPFSDLKPTTSSSQSLSNSFGNRVTIPPRNLKTAPGQGVPDSPYLQKWKERKGLLPISLFQLLQCTLSLLGLSERDVLSPDLNFAERNTRTITLAYRRCEYVTQLFSKTFYIGTSLMRPEARRHVWAIYAWWVDLKNLSIRY
jgi:hypothetical protein